MTMHLQCNEPVSVINTMQPVFDCFAEYFSLSDAIDRFRIAFDDHIVLLLVQGNLNG